MTATSNRACTHAVVTLSVDHTTCRDCGHVEPATPRRFEARLFSKDEARAVLGDALYDALEREGPSVLRGTVTVTSIGGPSALTFDGDS